MQKLTVTFLINGGYAALPKIRRLTIESEEHHYVNMSTATKDFHARPEIVHLRKVLEQDFGDGVAVQSVVVRK